MFSHKEQERIWGVPQTLQKTLLVEQGRGRPCYISFAAKADEEAGPIFFCKAEGGLATSGGAGRAALPSFALTTDPLTTGP